VEEEFLLPLDVEVAFLLAGEAGGGEVLGGGAGAHGHGDGLLPRLPGKPLVGGQDLLLQVQGVLPL
jgi:hypothetical protein